MIELSLLPQHLQSEPGGLIRATVTLRSPSPYPLAYFLEIHGLEESWYTLSLTNLTTSPQSDVTAVLTLHPPLEAGRGVYPFELLAICPDDPEASVRVEAVLLVERARPATTIAPMPASGGMLSLAALPRRWLIAGAIAAALLLCAGVAYALRARGHHSTVASPPACVTSTGASGCTATPTSPAPSATAAQPGSSSTPVVQPTAGGQVALIGTPHPGSGVLPYIMALSPGSGALPRHPVRPAHATPARQPIPAYLQPGSDGSPRHPGQPPAATPSASATASETDTATPDPTATSTPTATASATGIAHPSATTPVPTRTAVSTATGTVSTAAGTVTSGATFTPLPTTTPLPSNTPMPSATGTVTVSPTPKDSPTPAEIAVRYGYDLTSDRFILKWQTVNAQAFSVDGQPEPLTGQQSYDLRTHTFILTATSLDGTQSRIAVVAVVVVNNCEVRVNSRPATVPLPICQAPVPTETSTPGPSATSFPTGTVPPTSTPIPSNTPVPTATTFYYPTDTAIPTDTNTPIPTVTPIPSDTPIPTNTFTPVPTATPIPSATPPPTSTVTATPSQTSTDSPTPSSTSTPPPTTSPTATPVAPR